MDKKELYKLLHEHYDLIPDVDWWQHKQSKNWIITHNGVKKIASQPTIQGYTIHPPTGRDVIVFKDGSEGGIFGNEVVMGGDFTLRNKDNKVVRTAFRTGEANSLNVSKHVGYPWAMAEKRMFDRGVLDLLSFAELNVYSEIEANDFNRKNASKVKVGKEPEVKAQPKPEAKAEPKPVSAAEPLAGWEQLPPKPTVKPTIKPTIMPPMPEKKTLDPEPRKVVSVNLKNNILECLKENPEGVSKTEIWNVVPEGKEEIDSAINELIEAKEIYKTGERRGTKYHSQLWKENVPSKATTVGITSMTKSEYNDLWREASEELRAKGLDYSQMMRIVIEVTGHDTAISAFSAGVLTKEHIAEIKTLGTQLGT